MRKFGVLPLLIADALFCAVLLFVLNGLHFARTPGVADYGIFVGGTVVCFFLAGQYRETAGGRWRSFLASAGRAHGLAIVVLALVFAVRERPFAYWQVGEFFLVYFPVHVLWCWDRNPDRPESTAALPGAAVAAYVLIFLIGVTATSLWYFSRFAPLPNPSPSGTVGSSRSVALVSAAPSGF